MIYVCQLPADIQNAIMQALIDAEIEGIDLDNAMNSKISDLTETIDIYSIVDMA